MKTMKKLGLLLLVAAAGNSATAQNKVVLEVGTSYTITSAAEVSSSGGTVLYRWYRDGSAIPDATGLSYTVPTEEAVGTNVKFQRAAYLEGCEERKFSNPFTITWCNLMIDGVCWADANVTQPGAFAPRPDMYTEFYQWNQPAKAWPASGSVSSSTWLTDIAAPAWTSTPCPEGWRLPTQEEFQALIDAGGTMEGNIGGTWVGAENSRGAAVAGRFYGRNHATCMLPSNMVGCVFFPAGGCRYNVNGSHLNLNSSGYGWSSTQASSAAGWYLEVNSTGTFVGTLNKARGLPVRCVQ